MVTPFWQQKSLAEMTRAEWESICDGCGLCCRHKLQCVETNLLYETDVVCRLYDIEQCQCSQYAERQELVSDCTVLTSENIAEINWLPETCAYKRLQYGKSLPEWHHLITGDRETVHEVGASNKGKVISESEIDDLDEHVIGVFTELDG